MSHSFDDQVVVPNLMRQLDMLGCGQGESRVRQTGRYFDSPDMYISAYDTIVLCMSGGKDGIASLLQLIEMGVQYQAQTDWKPTQPEKNSGVPVKKKARPELAAEKPASEVPAGSDGDRPQDEK